MLALFFVEQKGEICMNIIKNYLTQNRCYQSGTTCPKIGIQIHTIGTGQGTAESVASYWNQSAVSACVHYCVDADIPGKVLQLLPETIRSWADAGYGNNNLITIEICESDYIRYTSGANYEVINSEKFKQDIFRGYTTAIELCAKICKDHGWDPLAKLPSGLYLISSHNEGRLAGLSSAHVDPDHVWSRFGLTMDTFRAAVKQAMTVVTYKVGTGWKNGACVNQIGAYSSLENAKAACKPGYSVYNAEGEAVYSIPNFKKGKKYTLTVDNYIRKAPSGGYVRFDELGGSAKKKVVVEGNKVKLKKGTTVQALDVVVTDDGNTWIKIKNGWLAAIVKNQQRLENS